MDKKQKSLSYEAVELFFNELFGPQFGIVKQFLDFLQNQKKSYSLKFDQWSCFLDLMKTIGDGFPNGYSTEDSWPTLFDEFYEWYCSKTGIPFEKKYKTDE